MCLGLRLWMRRASVKYSPADLEDKDLSLCQCFLNRKAGSSAQSISSEMTFCSTSSLYSNLCKDKTLVHKVAELLSLPCSMSCSCVPVHVSEFNSEVLFGGQAGHKAILLFCNTLFRQALTCSSLLLWRTDLFSVRICAGKDKFLFSLSFAVVLQFLNLFLSLSHGQTFMYTKRGNIFTLKFCFCGLWKMRFNSH